MTAGADGRPRWIPHDGTPPPPDRPVPGGVRSLTMREGWATLVARPVVWTRSGEVMS